MFKNYCCNLIDKYKWDRYVNRIINKNKFIWICYVL